jgi:hypothetical protein
MGQAQSECILTDLQGCINAGGLGMLSVAAPHCCILQNGQASCFRGLAWIVASGARHLHVMDEQVFVMKYTANDEAHGGYDDAFYASIFLTADFHGV